MHDPVTIVQSGHTFDREGLCKWLLKNPTRCPATGVDFGEKLQYGDNVSLRRILVMYMGDQAYQKYGDTSFREEYDLISGGHQLAEPDASTLYNLGQYYEEDSNGVPRDYERARLYYTLAVGLGHAGARNNLGSLYMNGDGVEQDYKKARHYYELAANQGNVFAQFNLGVIFHKGNGVEQDYDKARHYYELAANQGDFNAQYRLGSLYDEGHAVEQDYEKARYYFELAADQGYTSAQCNLGVL